MAKPRLTKAILADLTERYESASTSSERAQILDEYTDYQAPSAALKKPAAKLKKKALKKPKFFKPFRGKFPRNWSEVFRLPGLDGVSDHSGDSYGSRGGSPGFAGPHSKRRAKTTRVNVPSKKRKPAIKRKQPKKRKKRNAVGAAKKRRR